MLLTKLLRKAIACRIGYDPSKPFVEFDLNMDNLHNFDFEIFMDMAYFHQIMVGQVVYKRRKTLLLFADANERIIYGFILCTSREFFMRYQQVLEVIATCLSPFQPLYDCFDLKHAVNPTTLRTEIVRDICAKYDVEFLGLKRIAEVLCALPQTVACIAIIRNHNIFFCKEKKKPVNEFAIEYPALPIAYLRPGVVEMWNRWSKSCDRTQQMAATVFDAIPKKLFSELGDIAINYLVIGLTAVHQSLKITKAMEMQGKQAFTLSKFKTRMKLAGVGGISRTMTAVALEYSRNSSINEVEESTITPFQVATPGALAYERLRAAGALSKPLTPRQLFYYKTDYMKLDEAMQARDKISQSDSKALFKFFDSELGELFLKSPLVDHVQVEASEKNRCFFCRRARDKKVKTICKACKVHLCHECFDNHSRKKMVEEKV